MAALDVPRHIGRCTIARDFVNAILTHCTEATLSGEHVTLPLRQLFEALQELSFTVSTREASFFFFFLFFFFFFFFCLFFFFLFFSAALFGCVGGSLGVWYGCGCVPCFDGLN